MTKYNSIYNPFPHIDCFCTPMFPWTPCTQTANANEEDKELSD